MEAGYSGTPLARKLGIKDGTRLFLENEPENYYSLFTDWPAKVDLCNKEEHADIIHLFENNAARLAIKIKAIREKMKSTCCLWVSWYKKAAKMPGDVTEDIVRQLALANGLVDVKVCAVSQQWSGLKLVIPVKNR